MKRVLPPWCKNAKKMMENLDLTTTELADAIGKTREYTSAVINGRYYSRPAIKIISDYLNIPDEYPGNLIQI